MIAFIKKAFEPDIRTIVKMICDIKNNVWEQNDLGYTHNGIQIYFVYVPGGYRSALTIDGVDVPISRDEMHAICDKIDSIKDYFMQNLINFAVDRLNKTF